MNFGDPRLPDRFWSKVAPCPMSGCWLWTAALAGGRYGQYYVGGARSYAHRVSYEAMRGAIPDGLYVDHLCRTHICCNPHHLEAVTPRANVQRGLRGSMVTSCPAGHEYSEDNTYRYPNRTGGLSRYCLACMRIRSAARAVTVAREV